MKQLVSPIFESFLVLLHQNKIDAWTSNQIKSNQIKSNQIKSNQIWNKLNLSEEEKQRINQQQLYRLLRKLVRQGYLVKDIHFDNPRFSTFLKQKVCLQLESNLNLKLSKMIQKNLDLKLRN